MQLPSRHLLDLNNRVDLAHSAGVPSDPVQRIVEKAVINVILANRSSLCFLIFGREELMVAPSPHRLCEIIHTEYL
jgi:hypothetical protein